MRRLFTACALAFPLLAAPPFAPAARAVNDAFVLTTDFSTGAASTIDLGSKAVTQNVASVHSDASARFFGGLVYVANRLGQDNILRLDPTNGYSVVNQFSTGNGSNPHDCYLYSATRLYVARYEETALWEMNPATGAQTGAVDLSALADADGIPEMDQLFGYHDNLFVTVQRLDRSTFTPTSVSYLAVVDFATNTLVDTDPVAPGVNPIALANTNPFSEIQLDPNTGNLYLSCAGFFGVIDAGGVEMIDPLTFQSQGVVLTETEAGGDVLDVEIVSLALGYAIVATPSFDTELISFNPQTGAKLATIYSPGGYVLNDIDVSGANELYLSDRTALDPGVRVYNAATGAEITTSPLDVDLPPADITFVVPVSTGAGDTPLATSALGRNYPNPFNPTTTIPFTLARGGDVSLAVFDVSGRCVRTLIEGAMPAGVHEVVWDGRYADATPAASGVYFVRLAADGIREVRKVTLVK